MKIITALTGYTYDTYPFIILDINNVLYLFNLPDCCSRIFSDSIYSINKVRHIFLCGLSLHSSGGFLGSLIALFKPWKNEVDITCPNNINELITHNDFFGKMAEKYLPHLSEGVYSDDLITVNPVKTGNSLSYSIQCVGNPGKFLPEKAQNLGIKAGPNFSRLKSGETLYNDKGEPVTLQDCISEPIEGETVFIVDITAEEDIDFVPPAEELAEYDVIVHLTPIRIVNTPKYLSKFQATQKTKNICFGFSGRVSYKTVSLLYQNFVDCSDEMLNPISTCEPQNEANPPSFINLSTGDSFVFSPSKKVSIVRDEIYLKIEKHLNYNCPLPHFKSFAVTFLGTGAAMPARCRNDPGILVHTKSGFIALDVGEGYVFQLFRKYGKENAEFILKNMKLIFISHNHCDHSFGLHSLLRARSLCTDEKVQLYCNKKLINEVHFFESLHRNSSFNIVHVDSEDANNKEFVVFDNNNIRIKTVDVFHCSHSKGCMLTIDNMWKIAYSGDRKALSDDHFVDEICEVDLLIHEATFMSEHDSDMDDYDHSTMNHAIEVQKKMNAKYMALVHFSHKYDKHYIPCPAEKAFVAFDYLSFTFDDMEKVCKMVKKVNRECLIPS